MKKTLLSLLLLSPLLSLCQEKKNSWFLRPYGSVAAGKELGYDKRLQTTISFRSLRVYGAGIDVGRTFGQFYLSAGLGWQQMGELNSMNYFEVVPTNPDPFVLMHRATTTQTRNYLSLPISAGCNVSWFFVQMNVIPSYYLSGSYKAINSNDPNIPLWNEDPNYDPNYIKRDVTSMFNILGGLAMGIKIPVSKRIGVQIAADAKYTLIEVNKGAGTRDIADYRHLNLGGVAGLVYNLGK